MQKFISLTTIPVIGFPKYTERKKRGKGHVMVSMSRKVETVLYVLADGEYTFPAESIHVLMCSSYLKKEDLSVVVRFSRPESRSFKLTHKALDNTTTAEKTLVRRLYATNQNFFLLADAWTPDLDRLL